MATNGIENWALSTTPPSTNASWRENHSEYQRKPYIARNEIPGEHFLSVTVWEYLHLFSDIVVS